MAARDQMLHWDGVRAEMSSVRALEIPELEYFLNKDPKRRYTYNKPWSAGADQTSFIVHSSGSTGNPKPLPWSHRALYKGVYEGLQHHISAPEDLKFTMLGTFHNAYMVNPLPLCWGASIFMHVHVAVMTGLVNILLPTSAPFSVPPEYMDHVTRLVPKFLPSPKPKLVLVIVPTALCSLAQDPSYVANLRDTYDTILFVGAPLDYATGDALVEQGVTIYSSLASTDAGVYPLLNVDRKDWKYLRLPPQDNPRAHGFALEHFADGDKFEVVIHRQPNEGRPCFLLNPGIDVYHTRDLWQAVPNRPGFYQGVGRVDDFVKIASLTKFNAVEIERGLDRNSEVIQGSLVAGDGRPKPFVIIQPTEDTRALGREKMMDRIEGLLEQANRGVFHEVHLKRELVIITDEDKPIKRTAKGTIDRRTTLAMYQSEIDALYS